MTLKDKRIEWKQRYDAWQESELSVAEWCRTHDVKKHQMYYWVRQFENDEDPQVNELGPTQWLTVQMDSDQVSRPAPIYIHFDAISVEVRPGADTDLLTDVVHILQNRC
ncbi:hypothetical protein JNUCC1_01944 [Lentibacillus sp. JNUCC-1]|uniref:IS66 family insertion sequence element accessory protein TnpA n=1 Tax=Lentibacillus sp. JNUCC-1 TaxID=2654513 RepID=UPI0012E79C5F|nr:transposase [Lentibacillus sp. JNUCC-1]MUV38120.1 hypothetical protein [Lentibacillus sp. JNUCC-1]